MPGATKIMGTVLAIAGFVGCDPAVAANGPGKVAAAKICRMTITSGEDPDALISGTVMERKVWGPPNFGEHPKTDSRYRVWIIALDEPIRVTINNEPGHEPERVVAREVQFRGGVIAVPDYSSLTGKHLVVRGQLAEQLWETDHTRIVIEAKSVAPGLAIHCPH
jgi:hypothetical protein